MNRQTEALKLALEALNELIPDVHDWYGAKVHRANAAITAIRSALAEQPAQQQEPVIDHSCKDAYELIMKWADIYAAQTGRIYSEAAQDPTKTARMADERTMLACAVAQALSQAAQEPEVREQQEPVAQEWRYYFSHSGATGKPDEVVGPCFTDKKEVAFGVGCFDQTALCPPASKPWVGLTEDEQDELVYGVYDQRTRMELAIGIKAKLREKNT